MRNKNNDFSSEISYNKRIEKKEIEEIMDDVRENDQCLYYVSVMIEEHYLKQVHCNMALH